MTTPNNGLVLGEHGYRPGLAVADLYRGERREGRFWELLTCGVDSRPVGPMLAGCRLRTSIAKIFGQVGSEPCAGFSA